MTSAHANSEEELFFVAQKSFEDGFYDVSIRYINQFIEKYPLTKRKIEAQLLLGQCYFFKKQYLKAYDVFHKLEDHAEFKDATLFWLGETHLKGADYGQAEKHYKELIDSYSKSTYIPQAYYSLGWVYFEQEKYEPAQSIFLKLIQDYPTNPVVEDAIFKLGECKYNQKAYDSAIQYFKDSVVRFANSTRHAEAYFYIAESYYYLKDYLTASTYYAKSANIAADKELVLMSKISLGWSYLKLSRKELALKSFVEAKELAKENNAISDDIFLGLANLYGEMGQHDKAQKEYSQLIENFPNSPRIAEAYLGRGNIFYLKKEYQKAITEYDNIIKNYSEKKKQKEIVEKAQFGLSWSYLKLGKLDQSISILNNVIKQTSSNTLKVSALTQIGDAYHSNNQLQKAIEVYDQVLKDFPNTPYTDYTQFRQGIALLKLNKVDSAILSFTSLQANFPESKYRIEARYYLAVANFKKNDWAAAKDEINKFIEYSPDTNEFAAEADYILANAYYHLDEPEAALKIFQEIIKKYPEEKTIIQNSQIGIAKSLYQLGYVDDAVKKFSSISVQYSRTEIGEEALFWLGDYYLESGIYKNAIEYYKQIISDYPNSSKINVAFYELGQANELLSQYDAALVFYSKITNPKDKEVYAKAKLAIADIFSNKLDYQTAFETYQNIIKHVPDYTRDAYVRMAEMQKNSKEFSKAITSYQNAIKSNPGLSRYGNAELQFFVADSLELSNATEEAIDEYLKIPYLYPDSVRWIIKSYLRIGRIFEDTEKWDEAKTIYQKIIQSKTEESKFARERIDWINENFFASNK